MSFVTDKDVFLISEEIQFIKTFSFNATKNKTNQLKSLRHWLNKNSDKLDLEHFQRVWKGVFYNMWATDKPNNQEDLAEQIGRLSHCFKNISKSITFFNAFLLTMSDEWLRIDQWRINKFLMLVRRMMRSILSILEENGWSEHYISEFNSNTLLILLSENTAAGLIMHYCDIFLEELAKVSQGGLLQESVSLLIMPFLKFMGERSELYLLKHCRRSIFYNLLYQSDLGREYMEKYSVWKEMGFSTGSIDNLEEIKSASLDSNYVENDKISMHGLDPRAGENDILMPTLPANAKFIVDETEKLVSHESTKKQNRKILMEIRKAYMKFQNGTFPLGIKNVPRIKIKKQIPLMKSKISNLENMEKKMYLATRFLKTLSKNRRKKLISSLNSINSNEENYEDTLHELISKQYIIPRKENLSLGKQKTATKNQKISQSRCQRKEQNSCEKSNLLPRKKSRKLSASSRRNNKKPFTFTTSSSNKRVKIVLKKNTFQNPIEYINQVKNSPTIPYDAAKRPVKGLLKGDCVQCSNKLFL